VPNFVGIGPTVAEIWRFFDFSRFEFLTFGSSRGPNCVAVPNLVEIGQSTAEIWLFLDFSKMAAVRRLGFGVCVRITHEGHLVVFMTVQNLVGIDAVVLIICTFFDYTSLA